ncbi:putative CidB/LrgB family protein [Lupinus albus]|uniref:Putative CidB/LrgB family protein n=1 Tax=Lupinus albus TaxID=3870 RepID=A0A6A4NTD3_LUPAL|nr:putative CidB/LrgB family protein [Lupinus albus]
MASQQNDQSSQLYTKLHDPESGVPPILTSTMHSSSVFLCVLKTLNCLFSLSLIFFIHGFMNKVFAFVAIELFGDLMGMICILILLITLYCASPSLASLLASLFEPGVLFIHKWLPLFYAPYLVMLPLSFKDIPSSSGTNVYLALVLGFVPSLGIIGYIAILTSKNLKTGFEENEHMENLSTIDSEPAEPMRKPSTFCSVGVWAWTGIFIVSFVASLFYPTALGTKARTCIPFLLASTVLGQIVGSRLPSKVKKVFNPVIFCAASTILTAYAFGCFTKSGLDSVLGYYVTNSSSNPGAGDILMGFLGPVLLSLPFCMFQTQLVERHYAKIITSMVIFQINLMSSVFLVGPLLVLEPCLADSILPKCLTVLLSLIVISLFKGAKSSVATAAVVVSAVFGANYVQSTFPDAFAGGISPSSVSDFGMAPSPANEPRTLVTIIAYVLKCIFFLGENMNGVFG